MCKKIYLNFQTKQLCNFTNRFIVDEPYYEMFEGEQIFDRLLAVFGIQTWYDIQQYQKSLMTEQKKWNKKCKLIPVKTYVIISATNVYNYIQTTLFVEFLYLCTLFQI